MSRSRCVVADSGWSSTGLVMVTWTPGSTAPDSSVTLPKISPVVCAHADCHADDERQGRQQSDRTYPHLILRKKTN